MAVRLDRLRSAAPRYRAETAAEQAVKTNIRTAFLCHSHQDKELVEGFIALLREAGWTLYVDWADTSMPPKPDRITATNIKSRIKQTRYFLFLATPNSVQSRWCPWEIGYADGVKPIDDIIIVPTQDDRGNYYGNEYLQLYRQIDEMANGKLGLWSHDRKGLNYLSEL
ncbi:MAG: toll/interleukin-1 receptor domain-containing protein [Neoaquamicrobium sediminum]|uniref:toll/interleukin-1 receptor domain-containing protein n=1 Tax=Neoaquamicrobium sediminum TaxID=1849104 RepID=UPI004036B9EF